MHRNNRSRRAEICSERHANWGKLHAEKKNTLIRALKLGEQVAKVPGLALVPGVLDGTGEDGKKRNDIRFANVLDTRHWRLVIG